MKDHKKVSKKLTRTIEKAKVVEEQVKETGRQIIRMADEFHKEQSRIPLTIRARLIEDIHDRRMNGG